MAKTGWTLEEHRAAGAQLKRMHSELVSMHVSLSNNYGKADKNAARIKAALGKIEEVKDELEEALIAEHNPNDWKNVYFGPDRD